MIDGLDVCESCRRRIGTHRDDMNNRCLCTECWGDAAPVAAMSADELREFGDERYAEGADAGWRVGWEAALTALEAYAGQNPGARAWGCLAHLRATKG